MLDAELERTFGSAESLEQDMEVRLVFKGVTYESLCDQAFIATARKAIPTLDTLHAEYDAAKAEDPQGNRRGNQKRLFDL